MVNFFLCKNLAVKGNWFYKKVCVKIDKCYNSYFLPGGAVDHHEHLTAAAIQETKEEAGIDINLTGVLSIQYSPYGKKNNNGESSRNSLHHRKLCSFVYCIRCFTKG